MPAAPDYFAQPERIQATPRSQQIARLRLYYEGKQYDGRPDWWSGVDASGRDVPLRERKPCIVYPLPKAACNQATRFTFGEGRFPQVAVASAEEDGEDEGDATLSEEEAETVTKYLAHVIEVSRVKSAMRRLLRIGLSQRSAVVVVGVRAGKFCLDMPRPQDCWVEFVNDDTEGDVKRMVWAYPFEKEILDGDRVTTQTYWFRRDFTDTEVVFYADAKDEGHNRPVEWRRDDARTKAHKLGFCPVLWIRNLPAEDCDDIDGTAIYDGLEDELDALNFALSQRHRGIHYFGTPQAYETGVNDGESPGEVARVARPAKSTTDPAASRKDPYVKPGGQARKAAPDQIWSYQSDTAKVDVLETTGASFEAASKHVIDIRSRLLESMDVVLMDASTIAGKGEISAKALAYLYMPLLGLVDELRDCWWSTGLAPLLGMVLRITVALRGVGILVPQAKQVAEICNRFLVDFDDPMTPGGRQTIWIAPKMLPSWGAYFSPTNAEVGELVDATAKAKDAGLIGEATAKRNVATCFGEADTDEDDEAEEARPAPAGGYEDDDMDALHMDTYDEERRLLLPSPMLNKLRVSKLGTVRGAPAEGSAELAVWAVDGAAVRQLDIDFTDAGNPARYVYIPEGELWVEQRVAADPADLACDVVHEAIEAVVMAEDVPYESAHCAACEMEELLRRAFLMGAAAASTPAEALSVASTWLPGLTDAARGLAKAHAARKPMAGEEDAAEGDPEDATGPNDTKGPQAGAKPAQPGKPAKKTPRR